MDGIRFARRFLLHSLIAFGALFPAAAFPDEGRNEGRPAAVLPAQASERAEEALERIRERHKRAPRVTLFAPTALPEALPDRRATDVKFTVLVTGGAADFQPKVTLHVRQLETTVPMRDDGLGADLSAHDRIFSARVHFTAQDARAGKCYDVFATVPAGRREIKSDIRRLCASRIPATIATSDFSAFNVITFGAGREAMPVLADEVLIRVTPNFGDNAIIALAAQVNGRVVGSLPAENVYQIRLNGSQTPAGLQQAIDRLRRSGGVLLAAPNAIGGLQSPPIVPVTTSDPLLATQTNLDRINATKAWGITTGDPATLIAVIDTGADFDHPDFWSTPTTTRFATSGANLVAADCSTGTCSAVRVPTTCHATNVCNSGNAATDTYGHGTVVTGFLGAATDNATGIAAVNWQAQVLAVRYATANSTATAAYLLAALNYARGQGARIISISTAMPAAFVGSLVCPSVAGAESEGRLVVAAAGNDGGTGNNYPAACASAMPVANSTVAATLDVIYTGTPPSNFGLWVSIAAPGDSVTSTARTAAACPTCDPAYVSPTGYAAVSGTSFSTPLAAGAAGIVLARSPATTNADLRALLASTGVALQAPAAHIKRIDLLEALHTFNVAPTLIHRTPTTCINENTNTAVPVSVGTLTTDDVDAGTTAHEYTIVAVDDAAKFSIGGPSANLLMLSDGVLNFEAKPSYSVTVRSTDIFGLFVDSGFVVGVCDINEPPTISGGPFTLPENSANGTVVGSVTASDPDGNPLSFSITAGNTGGAFTISAAGQITVANSAALDFETNPVFTLTVTAFDGVKTTQATVVVNLSDVVETIPNPILVFDHAEIDVIDGLGGHVDRYWFRVTNFAAFPNVLFEPRTDLGDCGQNTSPSRTWVSLHNAAGGATLNTFCAFGTNTDLQGVWFAVIPSGNPHAASVYVELLDRATSTTYTSVASPTPVP